MPLITATQAAEKLGVSKRQLHADVRNGLLRQRFPTGASTSPNIPLYDSNEIEQLIEIKKKGLSLPRVAMMAQKAYLTALSVERSLQQIKDIVGIDLQLPDLSEEGVVALHDQATQALQSKHVITPKAVRRWAKTFYVLGPAYFMALEQYLGLEDPWVTYYNLATRIFQEMPVAEIRASSELVAIYGTFQTSYIVMQQSMFFYAQMRYGKRVAYKLFPDATGDMHEEMLALTAVD